MATQQPFELKGSLFTLTVLHLQQIDLAAVEQHLAAKVQLAPGFFQNIPVVIDLAALNGLEAPDFAGLIGVLRRHGLVAVAARNGSERVLEQALKAGLPALAKTKPSHISEHARSNDQHSDSGEKHSLAHTDEMPSQAPADLQTVAAAAEQEAETQLTSADSAAPSRPSRLHGQPVRSGQQIYAQGSDLIVIGAVSPGAEVLADGSVHIYGPLRGRALAGVQGDARARIFCQSLEAELVSIAGNYRILEEVDDVNRGKQMQIYLEQERLVIEPLAR